MSEMTANGGSGSGMEPEANGSPASARLCVLSVVVPVYNEAGNVIPLLDEIHAALDPAGLGYEVIFVDDASDDATGQHLQKEAARGRVRLLRHQRRSGQSAAVRTGAQAARGRWIATLDGDGQNNPADLPGLWQAVAAGDAATPAELERNRPLFPPFAGPVLVSGVRRKRQDDFSRRFASRLANSVRQALLRDDCPDSGCGIKLFRRDLFLDLPYFAAMHRFTPALFRMRGLPVAYVPVDHRPRREGRSKYGNLSRGLIGLVDLLGVYWLKRRTPADPGAAENGAAFPV